MEYKDIEHFRESAGYIINNLWYPRVTSIVSIKAKPILYRYYASIANFNLAEEIKNKSAEEGTFIHEVAQAVLTNKDYPKTKEALAVANGLDKLRNDHEIKIDHSLIEKRIRCDKERYSGTVDAVLSINNKVGVLDIKTSQAIYRDYNLQTAAYFYPIKKELSEVETRWILRIDINSSCLKCNSKRRVKGGKESIKLNYNNDESRRCRHIWSDPQSVIQLKECLDIEDDYLAFLGAKQLWEWEHLDFLKSIGYR